MPVDEAARLPTTPLPPDELEGELGGHSLQLVAELNAFAAAHELLRTEHDALEVAVDALEAAIGQNEAVDASEGQLAAVETRLADEIARVEDDVSAAAISAVDALSAEVDAGLARVADDAAGYADVGAVLLREEIARSSDAAAATGLSAVDALAGEVAADLDGVARDAAELDEAVVVGLRGEIARAADDLGGLLASEVAALNARINELHALVRTTDAVQTDLATIPIPRFRPSLLEVRVLAQRTDRRERALFTIEALCRAVPSLGTLTVSGVPTVDDQVEVGGVTYTFQDVLAAAFDVKRDAGTAEANIDNLVAAITLSGTPGVEYHADTTLHPTVTARKDTAATMEAVAKTPGTAGDAITTTDPVDFGGVLNWGGATLAGGSEMTVDKVVDRTDHDDDGTWAADVAAGTGSAVDVKGTGAAGKDVDWLVVSRATEL